MDYCRNVQKSLETWNKSVQHYRYSNVLSLDKHLISLHILNILSFIIKNNCTNKGKIPITAVWIL